jgi:hypothetical protein
MTIRPVDSPEFRRWFGASKVVDEAGQPLVVYHGSRKAGFNIFRPGGVGLALFFTDDREVADSYAWDLDDAGKLMAQTPDPKWWGSGKVYHVYLRIENPLEVNADGSDWQNIPVSAVRADQRRDVLEEAVKSGYRRPPAKWSTDDYAEIARRLRYDGVFFKNLVDTGESLYVYKPSTVYVVFEPTQIKSAVSNRGTFDPNDPNILHGLARRR